LGGGGGGGGDSGLMSVTHKHPGHAHPLIFELSDSVSEPVSGPSSSSVRQIRG